jgi:hypothetical protein
MNTLRLASGLGVAAAVAVLATLAAPYVLISEPGTGLALYYGSGPLGAGGLAFLAAMCVVTLLAGTRGAASPDVAAGAALIVGVALLVVAVLWATAVSQEVVFSFPADWMGYHRWLVVGVASLVPVSAAVYARAALSGRAPEPGGSTR